MFIQDTCFLFFNNSKMYFPIKDEKVIGGRLPEGRNLPLAFYFEEGNTVLISKKHFKIYKRSQDFFIVDLGSTNGTEVNGQPLAKNQPRALRNQDLIRLAGNNDFFITVFLSNIKTPSGQKDKDPENGDDNEEIPDEVEPVNEISFETICFAINEIFQHSKFQNDTLMAESPLHTLTVVQEARQTFMREKGIVRRTLCERDKAMILRQFLIKCLSHDLRPTIPSKDSPPYVKDERRKYLILHHKYVEGWSREEVIRQLSKLDLFTTEKQYQQTLQNARKRLSTIIWQKEMSARN